VELGGTKTVCVVGWRPDDLVLHERFPTTTPGPTLERAVAMLQAVLPRNRLDAIGVAAFGPLELRRGHPAYGRVTATPKPGWSGADVVSPFAIALGVAVGLETDVTAAALAERRWGAAQDCASFVYLTVGTGIGGGLVVDGRVPRGLGHPEMGHQRVRRADGDSFAGTCPLHGDCLEGLASGPAIERRWGTRPEALTGRVLEDAVELEARYLAQAVANLVYTVAPERVVVGGGVSGLEGLFPRLRSRLIDTLAGYPGLDEHWQETFVVPAALGGLAGPLGALEVARLAAAATTDEQSGLA